MIKAWRDLETARRVAEAVPPFYDVAVYHCQQAGEKAVKAYLIHHRKSYEQTHDIEVSVDIACEIDSSFSTLSDAADALTPYATRFRYPNSTFAIEPESDEFDEALQNAETIYNFVLQRLPAEARP